MERPICVLLLPRTLEQFILRDQAENLLRSDGVVAVEPAKVPYGVLGRLPGAVADALAAGQARRLALPGTPRAVVILHPFQRRPTTATRRRRGSGGEAPYGVARS